MKPVTRALTVAIATVVASTVSMQAAAQADFRFAKQPIEGQYIVVLEDEVAALANERANRPRVPEVAQQMARQHGAQVRMSFQHALRGFVVKANDRALERLLLDPRVAYVEEDSVITLTATQNNATWGLDRIDQRDRPLDSTYVYDTTASNVRTYIIDTGVLASHNDFGGRVSGGYTSISDGRGTSDCNGHGTHVAGTVAGATWGVAKAARIHPVRVLDCNGSGTNSGVIAGVDWVTSNHVKPAVANMSLGGGASSALDTAVNNSINAGIVYVVAAGNDNASACNYSPARVANAITVGSTTSSDARSSFSNYGSCLDIFAPGSSITSAWSTSNSATNTISGTSMASPHVAGAAALYMANNTGASVSQVTSAILDNASTGKLSSIGSGSPNRLLYSRFGGGDPDPDPTPGTLENGVPVSNLSGASGSETRFTMSVPSGASNLVFQISGGSGDADLYIKYGSEPTTSSYDCRPYRNGNSETCSFATPQAGTWHVMLRGYTSYSGVTLVGSYDEGGSSDPCTNCTKYTGSLSGTGDADVHPNGTYYYSSAGTHKGWLVGPTNADFDLELYRWSGSSWSRVARSIRSDSNEYIEYNGTSGYYYWRILSYSGSGSYEFWLSRP